MLFGIICREVEPFSPVYLVTHFFISWPSCEYLSNILVTMQCHITCGFSGHTVPALAIGNCPLSHLSLWLYPHPTSLHSDTTRYPRFILCILCPRSKISHFSKDPWFISFISSVRNPEPGAGSAHYYWSVTVPRSSQWRDYEIYVSTLTCGCSHFSNYFCISPSIYMLC